MVSFIRPLVPALTPASHSAPIWQTRADHLTPQLLATAKTTRRPVYHPVEPMVGVHLDRCQVPFRSYWVTMEDTRSLAHRRDSNIPDPCDVSRKPSLLRSFVVAWFPPCPSQFCVDIRL